MPHAQMFDEDDPTLARLEVAQQRGLVRTGRLRPVNQGEHPVAAIRRPDLQHSTLREIEDRGGQLSAPGLPLRK